MFNKTNTAAATAAKDIVDTAAAASHFSNLSNAIKTAGLEETLKGSGPYTVFAPTDDAFKKLAPDAVEALLKDKEKLKGILSYHVVMGKILAKDVKAQDTKTVQGGMLKIGKTNDGVTVDGANVIDADIEASNGVIHAIDTVVMPK